jgi:hypothetical protein
MVDCWLTAITFRYATFEVRDALSKIPDFRWCLNKHCNAGQIHESGSAGPICECHECGYKVCVHHNQKWHDGETCEQFDYRVSGRKAMDEEQASTRIIVKTTKKCPQCHAPIEKNEGCDHMTCKSPLLRSSTQLFRCTIRTC